MNQTSNAAERRAIVVDYHLVAAPAKVWRALTEPGALASWLMPNDIKPEVGHRFTFRTNPAPGFDGIVHCEIIEVERPTRLVYTWRGGPLDTLVAWTLAPTASGGTHLHLEQSGFGPEHGMTYDALSRGWREKAAESLERVASAMGE